MYIYNIEQKERNESEQKERNIIIYRTQFYVEVVSGVC